MWKTCKRHTGPKYRRADTHSLGRCADVLHRYARTRNCNTRRRYVLGHASRRCPSYSQDVPDIQRALGSEATDLLDHYCLYVLLQLDPITLLTRRDDCPSRFEYVVYSECRRYHHSFPPRLAMYVNCCLANRVVDLTDSMYRIILRVGFGVCHHLWFSRGPDVASSRSLIHLS